MIIQVTLGLLRKWDEILFHDRIEHSLDQARKQGKVKDGDLVLLVAFGSGFVWASALMRM